MAENVRATGVRPVAWGTWGLLATSGVLMTLVWIAGYPRGAVLTLDPPIYLGPSPGEVAAWVTYGLFLLGPLVIWSAVAWYSRTAVIDGVALAAAALSVALSVPAYVHQCVYDNGLRWYYPPAWVRAAFLGVWATGWAFGLPLLVAVRRQRSAQASQGGVTVRSTPG